MAIHPAPSRLRPCHKSRSSPFKSRDQSDIKVASHKLTLQHSVRSQKLDERQLNKFFKSLEDLKIKRIVQIDKEMSEQEEVLEKLNYDKETAREQRLSRRENSSRSTNVESDFSFVLPDHFKRGPRPSLRRGSSNFDLYAFMMRRESDVTPRHKKSQTKTRLAKQSSRSPVRRHHDSSLKSSSWEGGPVVAKEAWSEPGHRRVVSPGQSEQFVASPSSHFSAAESSISIGSLPPSSPEFDSGFPSKRFPSGSDWLDKVGTSDVNKGFRPIRRTTRVTRGRQQEVEDTKTSGINRGARKKDKGQNRTQDETSSSIFEKLSQRTQGSNADPKGVNSSGDYNFFSNLGLNGNRRRRRGPPVRKLKKAVSFHFPVDDEDEHGFVEDESLALGAGIMQKNSLLKDRPDPSSAEPMEQCKEPDCIFHNKAYRRGSRVDDYTIDDYYRTVRGKPTVSPLFMPADSPRLWSRSRRQAVRPPSPSPSDFLREFDKEPAEISSKSTLADSDSFLSVRRPLKGSNRERMLKDKEENVRTTFKVMRQKMAGQRPLDFNQNYGTPTPNWKILNPLKLRHKINQSNPLHARWGL